MECVNRQKNISRCTCTYEGCPRHGICCECIAYHNRMGEFPGCFFSKEGERTYDRTFERLVHDRKEQ